MPSEPVIRSGPAVPRCRSLSVAEGYRDRDSKREALAADDSETALRRQLEVELSQPDFTTFNDFGL